MTPEQILMLLTGVTLLFGLLKPVRRCLGKLWRKTLGRRSVLLDDIQEALKPLDGLSQTLIRLEIQHDEFEAFMTAHLNIGTESVFRTDPKGSVTSSNRQHQRMTGFSIGELAGEGWINVIHPEWRDRTHKKWEEAVASGREFSEDIMYVTPDGRDEYMVHVSAYREIDTKGIIRGYLGVVTPLTGDINCPHLDKCLVKS